MEIFANYDANFVGFYGNNVHDLLNNVVPNQFGVASKERHVDFIMDVADMVLVSVFLCLDAHFLVVIQMGGAVFLDGVKHLGILADAGWAVKNEIC
jgi:hypothetical protein